MSSQGYTFLGWVVWQLGSRIIKKKISDNQMKLGAAGIVVAVLVGGVIAARAGSGDD
jgi:hypothetical protein